MNPFYLITAFLLTLQYGLNAQNTKSQDSLKSIDQLSFMQGSWEGSGWIMKGRERKEFVQHEIIKSRVDNTILMIDGVGYDKESLNSERKIIHNAFGVISYNKELNSITMLSFSTIGNKMENKITLVGEKQLEWSFKDERGGIIRFREDFSKKGLWIENGDYSSDGVNWFPFFQMTLKKLDI